jgi:hypothetical protein
MEGGIVNKLEIGQYVRTEYGISKIVNIFFEKTGTFIETDNGLGNCTMSTRGKLHKGIYILEEDYKTFIDNNVKNTIIDLIEAGDYVNGYKVDFVQNNEIVYNHNHPRQLNMFAKDIKTIVTKEQFESVSYKVEE